MVKHNSQKVDELLKTQISLTEWLDDVGHISVDDLRHEDNEKRERLGAIDDIIGLPFDRPTRFTGQDLAEYSDKLKEYIDVNGRDLCALRLIPTEKGLPKLRMRGKTVKEAYAWFKEQEIDPLKYRADYIPHASDLSWATIFLVTNNGIFGEIVWGSHHQLTQGFHDGEQPVVFTYDFSEWRLSRPDQNALSHLKTILKHIFVEDEGKHKLLKDEIRAEFSNGFIKGYWETVDSSTEGLWFIDYNRLLGEAYKDVDISKLLVYSDYNDESIVLSGMIASGGKATAKVQIVQAGKTRQAEFAEGNVLVCSMTTPDLLPIMKKSSAIVTDQGGILSHAAIVARELKKPCIVGTERATKVLENGQQVIVDANRGVVENV